ncbi:MAG: thioredoxin domain-containing protein [Thaumarchaeota archaeon]|nr:thioredoxin domain-containing protein [Nitrososphaerota archaeon]
MEEKKPNRLISEKSPYLLEHSMNPVSWYPWGKEAFGKARNDNKPIFLSVGYSTCHWCHQFAKESFEDPKTAAYMNKNFIAIKVDREERPEVDAYYMGAVQAMTGGGGWPLSVFLTPDLKPFYGGTYFPPEPRYGMPSFMQVLEFVSNLWKEKRGEVVENSDQVLKAISQKEVGGPAELKKSVLDEGYTDLLSSFDQQHGGFGTAPKFPLPSSLGFMLRYNYRTGKELALKTVLKTLDGMMAGGIRDHIGGGFHRYSTDRVWLVPHFEKMLYDNAQMAQIYAEAYQVTKKQEYAEVFRETLGWMRTEMKSPEGGFYSAQDADTSEGEGTYYSWTPEEVVASAGASDGATISRLYGVTKTGNFEGRTILHLDPGSTVSPADRETVARSKPLLYQTRLGRPRPATDTKVLTSWNGLAISAFAFSSAVLEDRSLADDAAAAARFVLEKISKGGRLLRRFAGGEAALAGTLEDYAFFIQGLVDLFEATADPKWLQEALRLSRDMVADYEDKENGGFYLTVDAEPARLKESYDGPTPSGNSVAAMDLVRLSELSGDMELRKVAEKALKSFGQEIGQRPTAHARMLDVLDLVLNGVREVVITSPNLRAAKAMRDEVFGEFIPDKVVIVSTASTHPVLAKMTSLVEDRKPTAKARSYVCQNFACRLPADSVQTLRAQLKAR